MSDEDESRDELKAAIAAELKREQNGSDGDDSDQASLRFKLVKITKPGSAPCWKTFCHVVHASNLTKTGFVACEQCHDLYAYSVKTGTSSLNKHRCKLDEITSGGTSSIMSYAKAVPGKASTADKQKVSKAVASMCAVDLAPFSQVEDQGFKKVCETFLRIGMTLKRPVPIEELLPVANTVKNNVVNLAKKVRLSLNDICTKHFADGVGMAFTTDLWTDSIKKRSFMSVTCHYIDKEFRLNARTLQVKVFYEESHTALAILEAFQQCLKDFGCERPELCTVVSDSGSNMAAANGIRKHYTWLPCCDHKIATILTTVLNKATVRSEVKYKFMDDAPDVFKLIEACKELVTYFKQANLQSKLSSTLKQENATRWNSLLRLLQSVSKVHKELLPILAPKRKQALYYGINKELLDELELFLEDYQRATLKLERFKVPTLQIVTYEKFNLISACEPVTADDVSESEQDGNEEVLSDSPTMQALKKLVLDHGHPKWEKHVLYVVAALLDPLQKHRLQKFGISQSEISQGYAKLGSIMELVGDGPKRDSDQSTNAESQRDVTDARKPKKRRKTRPNAVSMHGNSDDDDDDDSRSRRLHAITSVSDKITDEINRYKNLIVEGAEAEMNLLEWWKVKSSSQIGGLPIMARAARSILCIPASSSMSECNFSDAGNTVTNKRNALSASIVDDTLVVRSNQDLI